MTLEGCEVVDFPFAGKTKISVLLWSTIVFNVMEKKSPKSKNNLKPGAQIMQTDWRIWVEGHEDFSWMVIMELSPNTAMLLALLRFLTWCQCTFFVVIALKIVRQRLQQTFYFILLYAIFCSYFSRIKPWSFWCTKCFTVASFTNRFCVERRLLTSVSSSMCREIEGGSEGGRLWFNWNTCC